MCLNDYVSSDLSFEPSQILVQKDRCRDSISQLKCSRCLRLKLKAKKKESPHNIAQTLGDLYKHFRTRTWVTSVTSWKCELEKNLAKMSNFPQTSDLFVNRLSPSFFLGIFKTVTWKKSFKNKTTPDHLAHQSERPLELTLNSDSKMSTLSPWYFRPCLDVGRFHEFQSEHRNGIQKEVLSSRKVASWLRMLNMSGGFSHHEDEWFPWCISDWWDPSNRCFIEKMRCVGKNA